MFNNFLALALLAGPVLANYHCMTNLGKFDITANVAQTAMNNGGTSTATEKSGYPHEFRGTSRKNTRVIFYGSDPRCNQRNPSLLEYPVFRNGEKYVKDKEHGHTETPARVVYFVDSNKPRLCGVMTHVIEDPKDHHGSGDFRVCDWSSS
ncbi:hypothetical protein K435DRAFT_804245 [Dendrothele bispora CBS 962.96]|uniref:Uncharacterized protein n=1 Tax=Dendrothele bispora (strain CBS 962.96) TaxID=1314807 RepID=A0A4S8LBU5_DENBC|nr:hypothetical protein K435DRAFT_868654 [Dendrothele bispora CBS 962.96]THU87548.1 hypothetical protein K435DRAFT_804245 [Dendrothele bispora CBS 962.96]